jgi:hypothetical protein
MCVCLYVHMPKKCHDLAADDGLPLSLWSLLPLPLLLQPSVQASSTCQRQLCLISCNPGCMQTNVCIIGEPEAYCSAQLPGH